MRDPNEREIGIANHLREIFGIDCKVFRTGDKYGEDGIFVFKSYNNPFDNFDTSSTIGLSNYIHFSGKTPLRVELIGSSMSGVENFDNLLASCAYYSISNKSYITYGSIIHNIVYDHDLSKSLEHATFINPFFWDGIKYKESDGNLIRWLMLIPISSGEANFILSNGIDIFEKEIEEKSVDILDLERDSIF